MTTHTCSTVLSCNNVSNRNRQPLPGVGSHHKKQIKTAEYKSLASKYHSLCFTSVHQERIGALHTPQKYTYTATYPPPTRRRWLQHTRPTDLARHTPVTLNTTDQLHAASTCEPTRALISTPTSWIVSFPPAFLVRLVTSQPHLLAHPTVHRQRADAVVV